MAEKMLAPMSGVIMSVGIKVGDQVKEDDDAMVMEAMKMETIIFAPCGGAVKEILVKDGAEVEEDDVLAIIE